jgi:sugar phosphate isomerase/epimerase
VLVFAETSNAIHGDIATPLSRRPVLQAGQWAEFGRRMSEVADATLREGVRLVYHHHMGTVVQDEADIDALMANTSDAVHLLLDTGHATWGGADPARLATRYRERISHVPPGTCSVVMARAGAEDRFSQSVVEGVYTVPGDSMVDARDLRALPDIRAG